MNIVALFFASLTLAYWNPLYAALVWTVGIAFLHMLEEAEGKLWAYFGDVAPFPLLKQLPSKLGFLLIVAPAFALQCLAAFGAFSGAEINVFWLALLIGARLGDGLFSHAIPFARGYHPGESQSTGGLTQLNPGLPTGVVYLVDGLLLTLLCQAQLTALPVRELALSGFMIGAGFFALVLPGLRLTGRSAAFLRR